MRKAILEGLVPEFSSTPFSNQMVQQAFGRAGHNTNGLMMSMGQQRANTAAGMMARGGQLVVAGSVVGQWGGNYGVATPHQHQAGMAMAGGGDGIQMASRGRGGGFRRNGRN
jgi:hypothetical protein